MYLIIYILILLILLVCIMSFDKVLLTPQFAFVACFVPQAIYALFYVKKWELELNSTTFFALSSGAILFVAFSYIIYSCRRLKFRIKNNYNQNIEISVDNVKHENSTLYVESWKLIIFVIFQIITIVLLIKFIISLVPGKIFSTAIYYFRYTNLFTNDSIVIPSIIRAMRTFSVASGYIWTYILIHSIVFGNKTKKFLLMVNIILSIINNLLLGARTGVVMLIVAAVVQYYFMRGKKYGWKHAFPLSTIFQIFLIAIIFIATFQGFATLMGRTGASNYSFPDYIAGYLTAELYNLNYFTSQGVYGTSIYDNQTINGLITILAKLLNHAEWIHKIELPFVYVDGYNYGNLYTIYYPFLRDMGVIGVFVYIPIMSVTCQIIYMHVIKVAYDKDIKISLVIYSYIYFAILFSFFSNKFYDQVVNTRFIWMLASWYIIIFYISKIKVKV